jgi:hypothetical protein
MSAAPAATTATTTTGGVCLAIAATAASTAPASRRLKPARADDYEMPSSAAAAAPRRSGLEESCSSMSDPAWATSTKGPCSRRKKATTKLNLWQAVDSSNRPRYKAPRETFRADRRSEVRRHCHRCNQTSEVRTAFHVGLWMHAHEEQHRQLDQLANGPLLDTGSPAWDETTRGVITGLAYRVSEHKEKGPDSVASTVRAATTAE